VSTLRLTHGSVPLIGCRAEDILGSSATIPPATLFYTSLLAVPPLSNSLRDLTTLPPVITAAGVAPYLFCCCLPSFLLLSAEVLVVLAPVCGRRAPQHQPPSKVVPCSRLGRWTVLRPARLLLHGLTLGGSCLRVIGAAPRRSESTRRLFSPAFPVSRAVLFFAVAALLSASDAVFSLPRRSLLLWTTSQDHVAPSSPVAAARYVPLWGCSCCCSSPP